MSFFTDPPLRDFPDHALRRMLQNSANLRDLFEAIDPDLASRFDFDRAEPADRAFQLDDWRERESDLLLVIPFRTEAEFFPVLVCVLLEHQSRPDRLMPLRTLVNTALFWERQWKRWEETHPKGAGLRLTPVLPVVVHTSDRPWNTAKAIVELIDLPPELADFAPGWRPLFWDLSSRTAAELLAARGAFVQLLSVVRAERANAEEFRATFERCLRQLEGFSEGDRIRWGDLLWFAVSWALRRRGTDESEALRQTALDAHQDVQRRAEVRVMSETAWKTIADELEERGEVRGRLHGARRFLVRIARAQLGEPDAATLAAVEAIADVERLEQLGERLQSVSSWTELLATP